MIFDTIVIGLGANGSSALYYLSKENKKILGIDRYTPPHQFGSSHGQSRIIRQAYHENPVYVPFVKEAYKEWHAIEQESGKSLLLKTGGLMLGAANASVITGAVTSAKTHDIAYEYLESGEILRRFPAFRISENTVGVLEKEAGILFPEECIKTYLEQAVLNGAQLQLNEIVLDIKSAESVIEITTSTTVHRTEKLIISAGAWTGDLLTALDLPLKVERQVLYWFNNQSPLLQSGLQPQHMPVYIWEYQPGELFYGFPDIGDGIKIARHHAGRNILPDRLNQDVSLEEIELMKLLVSNYINIKPVFNYSSVCMYTNTPDENFIIDHHPENKNIIIASPCSGHGFKFSSLTGKLLSEMAMEHKLSLDLSPFKIDRFINNF